MKINLPAVYTWGRGQMSQFLCKLVNSRELPWKVSNKKTELVQSGLWVSQVAQWEGICLPRQETQGDSGMIPGSGRSPWGGNGNPFQDLENPMDERSQVGYSPQGQKELDTTKRTCNHDQVRFIPGCNLSTTFEINWCNPSCQQVKGGKSYDFINWYTGNTFYKVYLSFMI